MAKWYGDDLRRKLLQAHDRGEGTLEQLAERFSVSTPWAWKISAQRKRSGQMERVEQRDSCRKPLPHGRGSETGALISEDLLSRAREQAAAFPTTFKHPAKLRWSHPR